MYRENPLHATETKPDSLSDRSPTTTAKPMQEKRKGGWMGFIQHRAPCAARSRVVLTALRGRNNSYRHRTVAKYLAHLALRGLRPQPVNFFQTHKTAAKQKSTTSAPINACHFLRMMSDRERTPDNRRAEAACATKFLRPKKRGCLLSSRASQLTTRSTNKQNKTLQLKSLHPRGAPTFKAPSQNL